MKLLDVFGRERSVSLSKYLINWTGPSRSKVQGAAKLFLRTYWQNDTVTEEFVIPSTKLSCDILNWSKRIAVEVDGKFHEQFSEFHHKNRFGFLSSLKRDIKKEKWLELNSFQVIRIPEQSVKKLTHEWFLSEHNISL